MEEQPKQTFEELGEVERLKQRIPSREDVTGQRER